MKVDCTGARRLVHLHLDGELPPMDAELLDQHLASCDFCERLANEFEEMDGALRKALAKCPVSPPPMEAVRRKVAAGSIRRGIISTWLPAAAAFILAIAGLSYFMRGGDAPLHVAPAVVVSGGETVHVFEPNQNVAQPGRTGTELQEDAVAWGLSNEPIALRFASGVQMVASHEAVVRIGRDKIDLFKGDLRVDLSDARSSFAVITPWGQFTSSGAIFYVHSNVEDGSAVVRVVSGEVEVERGEGTARTLEAGGQLTLKPDPHHAIVL